MKYYVERASSIIAAVILLQTLFFKFSGAPVSVYIFEKLGFEPYGRIVTGIIELVIALLLLRRSNSLIGALIGLVIISGAMLSHIFVLGIEVQGDKGLLFGMAISVFILLLITIILQKEKMIDMIKLRNKVKTEK